MNELSQFKKKQNQIFILVGINFLLFMVLFAGLGYVTWQSAVLVNRLKANLDQAEQAIAGMQERFRNMDMDALVDNLVATASERIDHSIRNVIEKADFSEALARASEKMEATQAVLAKTGKALEGMHETVQGIDNDEIARRVSYHILKGLGNGFQQAAETRRPAGIPRTDTGSGNTE